MPIFENIQRYHLYMRTSTGCKLQTFSASAAQTADLPFMMAPIAFVSVFSGSNITARSAWASSSSPQWLQKQSNHFRPKRFFRAALRSEDSGAVKSTQPRRVIGIIGKSPVKERRDTSVAVDPNQGKGIFGMRAKAYWSSMGALPLFFAAFGITALGIKMVKVKRAELAGGATGVSKITLPKSVITSEEEEAELHVFKCGGCGYEMYPARGREFKFFPDSFKCPLCGTPKSEFWDLNDPNDPRNQEEDDDDGDDTDSTEGGPDANGSMPTEEEDSLEPGQGSETTAKDRAETDSTT